jgi:hypothetical protein
MQQFKDTPEYKSVVEARQDLEKKPGVQAAVLKQNSDSALQEALALTLP